MLGVIKEIEAGDLQLISSTILELEITRNPIEARREHGEQVLSYAHLTIWVDEEVGERAATFVESGIKPFDALHLAAAESAQANYFCTCDDRFLRRAQKIKNLHTHVLSPLELVKVLEL